jgi:single-strand DNA-binding protein
MYAKTIIVGNLGADPETRGGATTFRVAVNERRKVDGEWQDATEWYRCVCFGRTAEILSSDARKGDKVFVEGSMRTSSWVDRATGETKYKTELVAQFVRQLGNRVASSSTYRPAVSAGGTDDDLPF